MKQLLYKFTANKPCRLIDIDGAPYLERYYLGTFLGWTFYLHRFVSGDGDRSLHDHPWKRAVSVVLAGSYRESRLDYLNTEHTCGMNTTERVVRWFNIIRGSDFHQILDAKPNTWTLFMHSSRSKGWGFLKISNMRLMENETAEVVYHQPFDALATIDWHLSAPVGTEANREPML